VGRLVKRRHPSSLLRGFGPPDSMRRRAVTHAPSPLLRAGVLPLCCMIRVTPGCSLGGSHRRATRLGLRRLRASAVPDCLSPKQHAHKPETESYTTRRDPLRTPSSPADVDAESSDRHVPKARLKQAWRSETITVCFVVWTPADVPPMALVKTRMTVTVCGHAHRAQTPTSASRRNDRRSICRRSAP